MPSTLGVVDLFAGPGGLGEGFVSLRQGAHAPFRIGISIEKEESAHRTLRLRAFLREYAERHGALPAEFINFHAGLIGEPDWGAIDGEAWRLAVNEARCLELGTDEAAGAIDAEIAKLRRRADDSILIGGPPCQAYSLVGRARAKGKLDYVPEDDERHYLFREYIRVLERLRPAAFVMENVKGILSSTVDSRFVFEMLMEDLASLGTGRGDYYELHAISVKDGVARISRASQPSDFVVRTELFGAPQRRHRVIIVGIRSDLAASVPQASILVPQGARTVGDAIGDLSKLRSGLSRGQDTLDAWRNTVIDAAKQLHSLHRESGAKELQAAFSEVEDHIRQETMLCRSATPLPPLYGSSIDDFRRWLERPQLRAVAQHETRGHMASDLSRYMFAAVFGLVHGFSPTAGDFPNLLRPNHRNWETGAFADRFRVQLAHEPATTVTSHISKDGHYFIHPDPAQCRSLTVREAARLQTFPDDYLFLGNRTQQYVQVGNAVPPYVARQIAQLILQAIGRASNAERPSGIKSHLEMACES